MFKDTRVHKKSIAIIDKLLFKETIGESYLSHRNYWNRGIHASYPFRNCLSKQKLITYNSDLRFV